jgi:hypothetical protein
MGGEVIRFRNRILCTLSVVALMWSLQPPVAQAQFTQQAKLVATDAIGPARQGSVSLSGDWNTAIVGGASDDLAGAAWVYTRTGGAWSQQAKLIGTGAIGNAFQGSVSVSGDGNTAIVGGPKNIPIIFRSVGAAWVYTRTGGVWSQQAELVGSGGVTPASQGWSVALSGDGNTAIVGGPYDNAGLSDVFGPGAAWVYTRTTGGVWSQEARLVATDAIGRAGQGQSVSLSGDGNTAIVGGPDDNSPSGPGAAWVFTRTGGVWSQEAKLVGTGAIGPAFQGSVSLSGDGNTAIVGGSRDDSCNAVN